MKSRKQITIPLSPQGVSENEIDQVLFEEAADSTKKLYLPRYRIMEEEVYDKPRFRVSLKAGTPGGSLTVYLERYPAPKIEQPARTAKVISHDVKVMLQYRKLAGNSDWEQPLEFTEITEKEGALCATFYVPNSVALHHLTQAMTDADYDTTLSVHCEVTVALPVDIAALIEEPSSNIRELEFTLS